VRHSPSGSAQAVFDAPVAAGLSDSSAGRNGAAALRRLFAMRVPCLRCSAVAAFVAAGTALLASCGLLHASSKPWWYQTGVTTCGPPALVRLDGHVMPVGNCAGLFLVPAQEVTLHVSQEIELHMEEEQADASGNQLVPVFPLPRSSRPSVLMSVARSRDGATGTYRAIRPGHAVLISHAWCLSSNREIRGSCPVIEVAVVP
jgi:hypothetical protein